MANLNSIKLSTGSWITPAGVTSVIVSTDTSGIQTNMSPVIQVVAGNAFGLALSSKGKVFSWGSDTSGQLGLGISVTTVSYALQVLNESNFISIGGSNTSSLALKSDGRIFTWGSNSSGRLGIGDANARSTPTQVANESDFVVASMGSEHSLALKSDGRVFTWGAGTDGRLGVGDILSRSTPTQVVNESDFVTISSGGDFSLALKSDGRIFAWGNNASGQLGLDDIIARSTPTQVVNESEFKSIFTGSTHSLALKSDGRIFAWGNNASGRLGVGDILSRLTPTQVINESGFKALTTNNAHSLALKSDGRIFAWGINTSGQLGLGTTLTSRSTPTQVVNESEFNVLGGGPNSNTSIVLKSDGRIFAWGLNTSAQLGLNDVDNRSTPTQLPLISNWPNYLNSRAKVKTLTVTPGATNTITVASGIVVFNNVVIGYGSAANISWVV